MTSLSSDERTTEALAALPATENLSATFVSQAGSIAQLLFAGGTDTVPARVSSQYPLIPGDSVRVQRRGAELTVLGPTTGRSGTGKITVVGATTCTVEYPEGSGVTLPMPYNSAYSPVVNDAVLISWDAKGPVVVCKVTAQPTTTTPTTPGGGGSQTYQQLFTATDSGSYRNGGWSTNDVISSDSNIGAWFYGTKIRDTIPDSAIILSARIYLPVLARYMGGAPNLGRHVAAGKPVGTVTVTNTNEIEAGYNGWLTIPTSHLDVLKSVDGGFGFNHGGYTVWKGIARDPLSGAVDVTYQA